MEDVSGDAHTRSFEDVCEALGSDLDRGIPDAKAAQLLKQYGRNELRGQAGVNPWKILLRQVTNGLTAVLILAMIVSFAVTDYAEGGVLVLVIAFNTDAGFLQEYREKKSMDALRKMASPSAKVFREGARHRISSGEAVSGDVMTFEVGDIIPPDCRLVEVLNLEVDEALLSPYCRLLVTYLSVPQKRHPACLCVSEELCLNVLLELIFCISATVYKISQVFS